jgi:hypothetical protein
MELVRNKHLLSIYHMKYGNIGGENECFTTANSDPRVSSNPYKLNTKIKEILMGCTGTCLAQEKC